MNTEPPVTGGIFLLLANYAVVLTLFCGLMLMFVAGWRAMKALESSAESLQELAALQRNKT